MNRSVLRYHGGKYRLASWIIQHFPQHKVYVEPYGGAASVLMQKPRSYAEIYNDLDEELVNVFRVLRGKETSSELERLLRLTPFSKTEFINAYLKSDEPIEQARRTIIKSFMGFGSGSIQSKSGFRANSNRSGTTPAHDWMHYPDCLQEFTDRLAGICIECKDAIEVIKQHDSKQSLVYADPPYVSDTRDTGDDYRYEMTDQQHEELCQTLKSVKGYVVLSGYMSDLYKDLYSDWHLITHKAFADGAKERVECLWLSPRTANANQLSLQFERSQL